MGLKQRAEPLLEVPGRNRAWEQLPCAHGRRRCRGEAPALLRPLRAQALSQQSRARLAGARPAGRRFAEDIAYAGFGTCESPSGLTGRFAGRVASQPREVAFSHAFPQALSQTWGLKGGQGQRSIPWVVSCCSAASEVFLHRNFFCYQITSRGLAGSVSPCWDRGFHVLAEGLAALRLCQHPTLVLIDHRKPQLSRISDSSEKLRMGSLMSKQSHADSAHTNMHTEQPHSEILGLEERSWKSMGKLGAGGTLVQINGQAGGISRINGRAEPAALPRLARCLVL